MLRWAPLLAAVFGLLFWAFVATGPLNPAPYHPPKPPEAVGILAPNEALMGAETLGAGRFPGPEDVAIDADGWAYSGVDGGEILRVRDGVVERVASTGGRPLGLDFGPDGALYVADALRGLLRILPGGEVEVLATASEGIPFGFTDDVDVAADGRVYFTDASDRFGFGDHTLDLMEGRPHGRLLRYDPATFETETLLRELYFANGVAVSPDGRVALVNESGRYRVLEVRLTGVDAGRAEVRIDNLPGFPDGISCDDRGIFWIALYTRRNPLLDELLHPRPWLKAIMGRLPRALWPKPAPYGGVLGMDGEGRILTMLEDPEGEHANAVTSVEAHGDWLYLGSLHGDRILRVRRPELTRAPGESPPGVE